MARRGIGLELGMYVLAAVSFLPGAVEEALLPEPYRWSPRADGVLRVATWNVGEGLERRGGLSTENVPHVAAVLRELDPDLCFLQEIISSRQLRALGEELGEGWELVLSDSSARRVAAVAQRGSLSSFETPDAGRRALGVVYAAPGRPPIAAIGLHADAFSARDRNERIGAAAEQLARLEATFARVLLGDLNLDLDLDKRRDLFTDDEYRDVETYNFVATRFLDAARGRGPTAEPDRRLDYVFVAPEAFEVVEAGPWLDKRAPGMDHDPVVADLLIRRAR